MPHIPRIYHEGQLETSAEIQPNDDARQHLTQVLRLQNGAEIIVFNGTDGEYKAKLFFQDKRTVKAIIGEHIITNTESLLVIHLLQAISRGEKMDFTIQKATELGVTTITPLFTEHCNVSLTSERLENRLRHWQMIAISAAEQSGRCIVPKIKSALNLSAWFSQKQNINITDSTETLKLILNPESRMRLTQIQKADNIVILIGPEGGLSAEEIKLAETHDFLSVNLGPRILRTETAALCAISILQAMMGDFR